MSFQKLKLSEVFRNKLLKLPETGMGYQNVKLILKNGMVIHNRRILNSEFLLLFIDENLIESDIETIELDTNEKNK